MNISIERKDIRSVRFRLASDVYNTISKNIADLFYADISDRGVGYVEILEQVAASCIDDLQLGDDMVADRYHNQILEALNAIRTKLAVKRVHKTFLPVLDKIISDFRGLSVEECEAAVLALMGEGWRHSLCMIDMYGGSLSKLRKKEIEQKGEATLEIKMGVRRFTYCDYSRDGHTIRLRLGTDSNLFLLFDLPFYFLHEYNSHFYPRWQDRNGRFEDAFLLGAQRRYMDAHFKSNDLSRRPFLGRHFVIARNEYADNGDTALNKADDCFDRLYAVAGDQLITFLMEWAAVPANASTVADRGLVLARLHALKDLDAIKEVFDPSALKEDFSRVYTRLLESARSSLNY